MECKIKKYSSAIDLDKAVFLLKWANAIRLAMFILPVLGLFFVDKGLELSDLFLIQGIYSLFIFFIEIPTGYIGDLFCKKRVLQIAFIFYIFKNIIWLNFSGFYPILIGQLFLGVCASLCSGTMEAYLYDVLKKLGKENTFVKEQGRTFALSNSIGALASIVGAFIYKHVGMYAPIVIEIALSSLAFGLVSLLPKVPEAKRKREEGKSNISDLFNIIKATSKHPEIRLFIIISAILGATSSLLFWALQPVMVKTSIPIALFGIFVSMSQISRAFAGRHAHRIYEKLKSKKTVLIFTATNMVAFALGRILLSVESHLILYPLLALFIIFAASQASLKIIISDLINKRTNSGERSTILSIKSMAFQISLSLSLILSKYLVAHIGLENTFVTVGILILLISIYPVVKFIKMDIDD